MVNTVSWKGEHRIIELLKINKKEINGKPVYDTSKLINSTDEDFKLINLYLSDVYKALGLKYGAAHAEVKVWSKNNKKYVTLIEVGARLGGSASPSALQEAQGYSQLSVLAKSYANPGFLQSIKQQDIVSQKNLTTVFLISNRAGMIKKDFPIDQIRSLKSYHSFHINVKKGDILKKTIDLVTCPGFIYLVGNKEDINRDIQVIRAWENNLYTELL